jgi:uncharacterized membrane protein YfcA
LNVPRRERGRHCSGSVDPKIAALICAGFLVGASVVVKFATALSNAVLEKVFTVALLLIGAKMLFTPWVAALVPMTKERMI